MQMNPSGKVHLSLQMFQFPFVSKNPNDIHAWNMKVDEYIGGIFDFA
jgi:hypothetical protein